jgi:putative copper resistance protein D
VLTLIDVLHLLAAAVWVGGTVTLVFIGVPVIRTLEGAERQRAMRMLGRRWRPLGWSALGVLGVTGLALAALERDDADAGFDAVLTAKVAVVGALVVTAYIHDFVLGPRLQKEIREGREQRTRPILVYDGWASFTLTIAAPVLGVVLSHLS